MCGTPYMYYKNSRKAQGVPDKMQADTKDASVEDSAHSQTIKKSLHKALAAKKAKALARKQANERRIASLKKYREAKKKAAAEQEASMKIDVAE